MRPRKIVLDYIEANGTATEAELDAELSTSSDGDGGLHNVDTSALLARLTTNSKIIKTGDDYTLPV